MLSLLRLLNSTTTKASAVFYLLQRGVVRLLPDPETITFLGFDVASAQGVSLDQLGNDFAVGAPIESTHLSTITPDSVIHQIEIKMQALQGMDDLIESVAYFDNAWNPAVERWNGKYLVSTRTTGGFVLNFAWFNSTADGQLDTSHGYCFHSYYGIGPGLTLLKGGREAGDPRMLVLDSSTILVSYTATPFRMQPTRMGVLILKTNHSTQTIDEVDEYLVHPAWQTYKEAQSTYHKNWSPFLYNGSEVLWAESLDPLVVVKVHFDVNVTRGDAKVPFRDAFIFSQSKAHAHWSDWGSMRGGTPGKLISKNQYLFFFHSRKFLPNNVRTTYFMGAFIMTAHPLFTMTHISRSPIYHRDFYEGSWDAIRFFDYVVYPMSFLIHGPSIAQGIDEMQECDHRCLSDYNVTLVLGVQDNKGAVAKINLGRLFTTMVRPG